MRVVMSSRHQKELTSQIQITMLQCFRKKINKLLMCLILLMSLESPMISSSPDRLWSAQILHYRNWTMKKKIFKVCNLIDIQKLPTLYGVLCEHTLLTALKRVGFIVLSLVWMTPIRIKHHWKNLMKSHGLLWTKLFSMESNLGLNKLINELMM